MEQINRFKEIEVKWQKFWAADASLWRAKDDSTKPKKYILVEFPYPSGAGLHVGHVRSWAAMDIYARKSRMGGFNVLYPMGWDAFGLPAENYALKMGVHPSKVVPENVATFKKQCKEVGLSFDWSREIDTTDPKYYKWTQWIFLQLYKKGLAKRMETQVNWCPFCKTTLANEEVGADGNHERCGKPTETKTQKQWVIKITEYADRLIDDLKLVDYSPNIALQQVNWIGRKEGLIIDFKIENSDKKISCFTKYPETIFGTSWVVVSPEFPDLDSLITTEQKQKVDEYINQSKKKSEMDRTSGTSEKTGVFIGSYVINPVNNKKIPVWIGDYVLANFGTGAVMGVAPHDSRDFMFAQKYGLEMIQVEVPKDNPDYIIDSYEKVIEDGIMINSEQFNGMKARSEAYKAICDWMVENNWATRKIEYHLRDWIFSRQHYWGEPIPIVHCEKCGEVPVPEDQLPVELPYVEKYEPSGIGESPLANISEWVNTTCPKCGGMARRETDTMPNWAGSNWYFLRYLDPQNDVEIASREKIKYWMPVDMYQGGFEHTTLHLLYSRFIHKFLFDIGVVPCPEPYAKRRSHGIVLGADGSKMSKTSGNVINPSDIIKKIGADALRIYEMFMGPFDQMVAWSDDSASGCYRFLIKIEKLLAENVVITGDSDNELLIKLNKTIVKVGSDIENFKFNTSISTMMEFVNTWQKSAVGLSKKDSELFLKILAPFAPHLAEELWHKMGSDDSIHQQSWPVVEEKYLVDDVVKLPVAINGKVRDVLIVKEGDDVVEMAKQLPKIKKWIVGKKIIKEIYIKNKMVNFVVG